MNRASAASTPAAGTGSRLARAALGAGLAACFGLGAVQWRAVNSQGERIAGLEAASDASAREYQALRDSIARVDAKLDRLIEKALNR